MGKKERTGGKRDDEKVREVDFYLKIQLHTKEVLQPNEKGGDLKRTEMRYQVKYNKVLIKSI